jgi:SusD family.
MKTKYLFISLMAIGAGMFSSCENKLDIPQKGVVSVEFFYQTDDDAMEAITAVYNNWRSVFTNGFQFKNLLADDLHKAGAFRQDNEDFQNVWELTISPSNCSHLQTYFSSLYQTIYKANLITDRFTPDSDIKSRVLAEAKFFRAYCYFELVNLWGRVPLVTKELSPSEYKQPNSEVDLIWAQIELDMTEAIQSGKLPSKSNVNDNETSLRLTKEAAYAYLGKIYLYQKKYSEAKAAFANVVSSGKYGLIDDFGAIYHMEADNCKEYLFEANRHFDPNNLFAQGGWLGILCNWHFGAYLVVNDIPLATSFYDFKMDQGYGFFNPSKTLRDAFIAEEGENGYRLNLSMKTWDQMNAMGVSVNSNAAFFGNEGIWRWKFLPKQSEEHFIQWGGNYSNTPALRYADVLLMMAEVCVQTGDPTADTYFNEVRTRAKMSNKTGVTLDDIKRERRLELAMEAVRFQDLVRWGDAATVLADKGKKLPTFRITTENNVPVSWVVEYVDNEKPDAGFTVGKDELLPFPQTEMNVNNLIEQNPNY